MTPVFKISVLIITLLAGIFFVPLSVNSVSPIAVISKYEGDVTVMSGKQVIKVMRARYILANGDHIQTKDGSVQITFQDGAILKLRPYTQITIQERSEQRRLWFFKTRKSVRRITTFVGKLFFRSGVSKRRNHLQTPTAICGIRGTELEIGFDNAMTYLRIYTGTTDVTGRVTKGLFADPEMSSALRNLVFRQLDVAIETKIKADRTRRAVDYANLKVEVLKVRQKAFLAHQKNPDELVVKEAKVGGVAFNALIGIEKANVVLEKMKAIKSATEMAVEKARMMSDEYAFKKAEKMMVQAEKDIQRAEDALGQSKLVALEAEEAIEKQDLEKARKAAKDAKVLYVNVQQISKTIMEFGREIVPTDEPVDVQKPLDEGPQTKPQPGEEPPKEEPPDDEITPPDTEVPEDDVYREESSPSQ